VKVFGCKCPKCENPDCSCISDYDFTDKAILSENYTELPFGEALLQFIKSQKPCPPDVNEMVNDNFWDLV